MHHDIILLGASAGGVDALTGLCRGLPNDLPAAVMVVQHVAPTARSVLPQLLDRAGPLPAAHAEDGEVIRPGQIYVARPDHHLLVNGDGRRLMLRRGPQENRTRPAIDPLFRSAAVAFGPRVVGVVLSGLLDDGTAGLVAIKACGGVSVVQDPATTRPGRTCRATRCAATARTIACRWPAWRRCSTGWPAARPGLLGRYRRASRPRPASPSRRSPPWARSCRSWATRAA